MKKILIIGILFICQNLFSQEYHFDKLIIYDQKKININSLKNIVIYINTKNPSYYLVCHVLGEVVSAYIKDKNLNLIHYYTTDNFMSNTDFEYLNSIKLNPAECNVDCTKFGITEEKIDSIHTKLIATQYLNKKKTRIYFQYQTVLEPFDYDGLDNFLEILQHHYLFCEYINTSQKSIPNYIEMGSTKDKDLEIKLKKIQSITVDFKVDKEKIVFKN